MARLLKFLLVLVAGIAGILIIAAVSLLLFFDPNDFRDQIAAAVKKETGRELTISGDISISIFPWLAVEVGPTELGNAEGFDADRFLSFDEASLSVRILPLIFSRQVEVGSATLNGLEVNLEVAPNGATNWDDLTDDGEPATDRPDQETGDVPRFDVAKISVNDANVSYADASTGSSYAVSKLSFETDRIAANTPIDLRAEFDFDSSPGELGGHLAIRGTATMTEGGAELGVEGLNIAGTLRGIVAEPTDFNFDSRALSIDTAAKSIDLGEMDLSVLGLAMSADVDPFSYAGTPRPSAELRVAQFSLKELMQILEIEPPVTADPDALERVSFSAKAAVGDQDLSLSAMTLELDDSTMTGSLSVPTTSGGALKFDLNVDTISLDGYMAPAGAGAADDEEAADVEIPVDLIRTLNVNGKLQVARAYMTGMEFENLELGVVGSGGRLRLHPLAAAFYDGEYAGDVRIDASRDVPSISVNERISDVNLGALAQAMYDVDNITGTVNGSFVLSGSGGNVSAIRQDLDGNIALELIDGAWEGTDIWYQLRRARAMYRQEPIPKPELPARTEFSSVRATGVVTDGVFENNDFLAELPFLRLTGGGLVDLGTAEIDYAMEVRVLEKPELMAGATAAELADFTETVVPLKITGPLSSPSVRPDIEGIFRARVEEAIEEQKEELKDKLLDRLLGGEEPAVDETPADQAEEVPEEETEEDLEEKLKKDLLKKILER